MASRTRELPVATMTSRCDPNNIGEVSCKATPGHHAQRNDTNAPPSGHHVNIVKPRLL